MPKQYNQKNRDSDIKGLMTRCIDCIISLGCQYNLNTKKCTNIDLACMDVAADDAKLLARFLTLREVLGQIKHLNLRFVSCKPHSQFLTDSPATAF